METKEIKVRFDKGYFIPLEKVDFKNGEVIEIEIIRKKPKNLSWKGALKHIKSSSVELQHKIKEEW